MFYLDFILYTTLIILAWILIDKIINQEEGFEPGFKPKEGFKPGFKPKEGFEHRGNAVVAGKSQASIDIDKAAEGANTKRINVIQTVETIYGFVSIFADVFVKYPNQYIMKMGGMAQGPIQSIIEKFNEVMNDSNEKGKEFLDKIKIVNPFSIVDFTNIFRGIR